MRPMKIDSVKLLGPHCYLYAIRDTDFCMYTKMPINLCIRKCIVIKWRYIQFAAITSKLLYALLKLYLYK